MSADQDNLAKAIAPKSDQLNSEDLIVGALTIKIRKMEVRGEGEQPISVFFEGDNSKPYKPCKSMARVMVMAWGSDPSKYIGRSMTLYRDPSVKWGGLEVGGIRISHLSDIDNEKIFVLTNTRGSKKPYTVKPLVVGAAPEPKFTDAEISDLKKTISDAAAKGIDHLRSAWQALGGSKQKAVGGEAFLADMKTVAAKAPAAEGGQSA